MTPMIGTFTTSAKDLNHMPRMVVMAFLLACRAASIDLSRLLLLLVVHSDVEFWDHRRCSGYVFLNFLVI